MITDTATYRERFMFVKKFELLLPLIILSHSAAFIIFTENNPHWLENNHHWVDCLVMCKFQVSLYIPLSVVLF